MLHLMTQRQSTRWQPDITEATATSTFPAASNSVQTDRNGVAKIYYQLSAATGDYIQLLRLPTAWVDCHIDCHGINVNQGKSCQLRDRLRE